MKNQPRSALQRIGFRLVAFKERKRTIDVFCACGWEEKEAVVIGSDDAYKIRRAQAYEIANKLHPSCPLDDIARKGKISLKRVAAAAKEASVGPWYIQECNTKDCWCRIIVQGPKDDGAIAPSGCLSKRDAEFMAAANPAVVLRMVQRIKRLEKALDEATMVMEGAANVIESLDSLCEGENVEVQEERDRIVKLRKVLKAKL